MTARDAAPDNIDRKARPSLKKLHRASAGKRKGRNTDDRPQRSQRTQSKHRTTSEDVALAERQRAEAQLK